MGPQQLYTHGPTATESPMAGLQAGQAGGGLLLQLPHLGKGQVVQVNQVDQVNQEDPMDQVAHQTLCLHQ